MDVQQPYGQMDVFGGLHLDVDVNDDELDDFLMGDFKELFDDDIDSYDLYKDNPF